MERLNSIPSICIVGRPNVGKSSLFNCLLGERRAVVIEQSGTTRDRVEALIKIKGYTFKLIDTGGYLKEDTDVLSVNVKEQIKRGMEDASLIIMVGDAQCGISPADREVTEILRKADKPVILVVNKADNNRLEADAVEFYQLGLGDPMPVSCLHRKGLAGLKDIVLEKARGLLERSGNDGRSLKVAVVGRPNVGKSSFVNALLKTERVITSDMPGTTRDSIDTYFSFGGDDYILIDTAGIRHKRKIKSTVDTFSMMRSLDSIRRADAVILLLDAADGVTRDDTGILDHIEESGKACLIAVNKWDLSEGVEDVSGEEYVKHLLYASPRLRVYPFLFISAHTGKNVLKSISTLKVLDANLDQKFATPLLNRLIENSDPSKVPVPRRKKRPNFLYVTQTSARPVEFSVFVNDPKAVTPAHLSFIENVFRESLSLKGIPIKINVRRSRKEKK